MTNATLAGSGLLPEIADEPVVRRRRPGQWLLTAVLVLLAAMLVSTLITNSRFEWATVGRYLFTDRVLDGVLVTIKLTAWAMGLGLVVGIPVAVMRLSQAREQGRRAGARDQAARPGRAR